MNSPFFLTKLLDGRLRWLLIFWMFLMSAVAYLDRVNISIAGQAIQKDFGLTDMQLGWVFSAFVIGYALFQVPGGRLADRFGARLVISVGVLWWGAFTTLTAWVPSGLAVSVVLLIVTRFLLGLGEAVVYPSSNRLVSTWIPSSERGLANGLIFAGVGAGAGVTPPIIIFILYKWGWHWSFYISALIGLAAGAVWFLIARDTPREHPLASQKEIEHIEAGLPPATKESCVALPWRAILGSRNVLAITFSYFAYGYVAYIFFTWFFIYLSRVRGLDLKSSALYSMLPFIAMACAAPLGGWVADRITLIYGRRAGRCWVAVFGLSLAAVFLAVATQVESARVASIVLAGGAGALYLAQSAFWAVTADIAGKSAGTVSGLMNMGAQVGGAVTASLTPWIANRFGWTPSFLVAAGLCFAGALAWLLVDPDAPISNPIE
ncbi:MAG: MFS transporter [Verrucomicrobiaceae bacterium]|nr:MAG: MFS transporter [Verrucomicrobiaceae bacterium]